MADDLVAVSVIAPIADDDIVASGRCRVGRVIRLDAAQMCSEVGPGWTDLPIRSQVLVLFTHE